MAIENVDAWVCVLRDGTEWIRDSKPRWDVMNMQWGVNDIGDDNFGIQLPKGTIRKLIGKDLGFMDEPVKLPEKFSNDMEKKSNATTISEIEVRRAEARAAYFEKRYWTEKLEELDAELKIYENGHKRI